MPCHAQLLCEGGNQAIPGVDGLPVRIVWRAFARTISMSTFFSTNRAPGQNVPTGEDNHGRGGEADLSDLGGGLQKIISMQVPYYVADMLW